MTWANGEREGLVVGQVAGAWVRAAVDGPAAVGESLVSAGHRAGAVICCYALGVRWIVRGDIDGFFGLALDNLVQLLLIDTLCRGVLGFPAELVYGRVLPAAAISILVGNIAYALQARRLAARTGRRDVCALPYGINTVSLFAHVFLVMLPAKALARAGRRRGSGARRVAGGPARHVRLRGSSSWRRVRRRARAQGDAARGAALDARRHRARLHLARLPVPHVRAPGRSA